MTSVQTSGRRTARSASPIWRLLPAVALTAVVGVLLGRFAFVEPARRAEPIVAAVNPSPPELLASLEVLVEQAPGDATGWQQLGAVAVAEGIRTGDLRLFTRADEALRHAEELAPDAFGTRLGRASLALTLHRFDEALAEGRAALAANPFSAEALGVVVDAQVELGGYDGAATDLQRMLDIDPGLPALARTSYLRELHGDLPGALQAMQQAEAAGEPTGFRTAVTAALVGDLHLRLGELDDATAAYERAAAAYPGLVAATVGRASVLASRGDLPGAIGVLSDVVDRTPSVAAATLLGDLLRIDGRAGEAVAADQEVRTVFADESAVGHLVDLDLARFETDRTTDPGLAVELARAAYALRPDNVAVNDALGWALVRAGEPVAAIPYVDAALRLGTLDPAVRLHAAVAFAAAGQRDRATAELRIALDRLPWSAFGLHDEARSLAADLGVEPELAAAVSE